jgi:hypothetical protein
MRADCPPNRRPARGSSAFSTKTDQAMITISGQIGYSGCWVCRPLDVSPAWGHVDQPSGPDLPHPTPADHHRSTRPAAQAASGQDGVPQRSTRGHPQRARTHLLPASTPTKPATRTGTGDRRRPGRIPALLSGLKDPRPGNRGGGSVRGEQGLPCDLALDQFRRHPTSSQSGHQRLGIVDQPLVRRGGQGNAGQEHEPSALRQEITAPGCDP